MVRRLRPSGRRMLAAACAGVGLVGMLVVGANPASARELEGIDVTEQTTTRFWAALPYRQLGAGIVRYEDYSTSPTGRYVYSAAIGEMWDNDRHCILRRNGRIVADARCSDMADWDGPALTSSGRYALTVGRKVAAHWTFRLPAASPPVLAAPTCELRSVTPTGSTATGPIFTLDTNGRCQEGGYWYYQVDYAGGGQEYRRIDVPKDGRVLAFGLYPGSTPCTITFAFLPEGYVQQSTYALSSPAGPFSWTPTATPASVGY